PREVVRQVAAEVDAPLWELDRDFSFIYSRSRDAESSERSASAQVEITARGQHGPFTLGLLGEHQAANAAVAVAAVERLRDAGMPIPDHAIARGLREVRW